MAMVSSLRDFEKILSASIFAAHKKQALTIPEEENLAFFIELPSPLNNTERLRYWQAAKDLLPQTGHWPILIQSGFSTEPWPDADELFNRFFYREEDANTIEPQAIIQASRQINVENFFSQAILQDLAREPLAEKIATEVAISAEFFKADAEEIKRYLANASITDVISLEQALWIWEEQKNPNYQIFTNYQNWYEPLAHEGEGILFLPTANAWESLAYLHFFGASLNKSSTYIAIGNYWQKHYGAEMVAHYGTMLHCITEQTPTTALAALTLAYQQRLFAPCTLYLPGVSLRDHARYLLKHRTWFLHERP
jgi:hypothetical protein